MSAGSVAVGLLILFLSSFLHATAPASYSHSRSSRGPGRYGHIPMWSCVCLLVLKNFLSMFEIFYYCITRTVTVKKGIDISRHAHKVSCSCTNLNDPLHSYSPFWALFQCSGRSLSNWSWGTKWFNSIALPYIRGIHLLTRDSNWSASLMILKDIESRGQSKQEFRLIVFWVCPKAVKLNYLCSCESRF